MCYSLLKALCLRLQNRLCLYQQVCVYLWPELLTVMNVRFCVCFMAIVQVVLHIQLLWTLTLPWRFYESRVYSWQQTVGILYIAHSELTNSGWHCIVWMLARAGPMSLNKMQLL